MTHMEAQMTASAAAARKAIIELRVRPRGGAAADGGVASAGSLHGDHSRS